MPVPSSRTTCKEEEERSIGDDDDGVQRGDHVQATLHLQDDRRGGSGNRLKAKSAIATIRRTALFQTLFWLGLALIHCELYPTAAQHQSAPPFQQVASKVDRASSMVKELRSPTSDDDTNTEVAAQDSNDVIVVVAVDGTVAGLSRDTGEILWSKMGRLKHVASAATTTTPGESKPKGFHKSPNMHGQRGNERNENNSRMRIESGIDSAESESPIMDPLLTTTTTTKSSSNSWQTAAVPGIDGSVYITAADVTVSTNAKDLVERSPFLDSRGRFYIGSRHSSAAALDGDTGEVLHVVSSVDGNPPPISDDAWDGKNVVWIGRVDHSISIHEAQSGNVDVEFSIAEIMSVSDMAADTGKETWKPASSRKGQRQQESTRRQRSQSVYRDGTGDSHDEGVGDDDNCRLEQSSAAAAASSATLSSAINDGSGAKTASLISTPNGNLAYRNYETGQVEWVVCEPFNTPIAFAIESNTGLQLDVDMIQDLPVQTSSLEEMANQLEMQWDNANSRDDSEEHTIVGALKNGQLFALPLGKHDESSPKSASSGVSSSRSRPARLEIGQHETSDSIAASNGDDGSTGHECGSDSRDNTSGSSDDDNTRNNGMEIEKNKRGGGDSSMTTSIHSKPVTTKVPNLGARQNVRNFPDGKHAATSGNGDKKDVTARHACNPTSANFPACLVGAGHGYKPFAQTTEGTFLSETAPDLHNSLALMDTRLQNALVNYEPYAQGPNGPHDQRRDMNVAFQGHPHHRPNQQYNNQMHSHPDMAHHHLHPHHAHVHPNDHNAHHYQQLFVHAEKKTAYQWIMKLLSHWIGPTIVIIFVLSFEMGRRKRQKDMDDEKKLDLKSADLHGALDGRIGRGLETTQQVIQVSDDVLGFGGQGTVVYRGMLEGRNVAVKRMLKAYIASADREISLLIESDGHPNVVRYFLKEVRGDFVYLALELCDLSLHDLIATLRNSMLEGDTTIQTICPAVKRVLQQIASGVKHIHSLRIVHRDLKPANILLAASAASSTTGKLASHDDATASANADTSSDDRSRIYNAFLDGQYDAKISDMGLGKQLLGQSSFGVSTMADSSLRGQSKGGTNSVGVGPGSVGWQAPEVMAQRWTSDSSMRSEGSNNVNINVNVNNNGGSSDHCNNSGSLADASPMDAPGSSSSRTSRSVDIFSLGCIFHSTLIPGVHPFGEWYEREANIMHNRPNTDALVGLSVDAQDLVSSMIHRSPRLRPSAQQICEHPFFWTPSKRLAFACDLSDRIEADITMGQVSSPTSSTIFVENPLLFEKGAADVVGTAWDAKLDDALIANVQRFRTYDPSSVRDLLRLIRNKHHHFDELPLEFRQHLRSTDTGLLGYFENLFPKLLMHCYNLCRQHLPTEDPLAAKYCIVSPKRKSTSRRDRAASIKDNQQPPRILEVADDAVSDDMECEEDELYSDTDDAKKAERRDGPEPGVVVESTEETASENAVRPIRAHSTTGDDPKSAVEIDDTSESIVKNSATAASESNDKAEKRNDDQHDDMIDEDEDEYSIIDHGAATAGNISSSEDSVVEVAKSDADDVNISSEFVEGGQEVADETRSRDIQQQPRPKAQTLTVASAVAADADAAVTASPPPLISADVDGIIVWEGSSAAKTFNCRGWSRSDDEWARRADKTLRKRDPILVRCADDPKFRTRLCNHWDQSLGTFCPMRRKNKCVFAHGPVELRVKEAKRNRWGKLVDRNGNNSNLCHSGGEDTYGAARSIESVRKEEGKWNTGKGGGGGGGGGNHRKGSATTPRKKSNKPNNRNGGAHVVGSSNSNNNINSKSTGKSNGSARTKAGGNQNPNQNRNGEKKITNTAAAPNE
eukprot:CAMPEP_0119572202 /NCGR_PEP_ID=MMETSP1352-20130426/44505_1 /TAXON_ID=265584 /ORGANISM="Stauroneis constricta, Strain CCMP1120" /LENGTH=1824 /DNA_ID=CAMNT_0007621887 /DNA_START=124 /DNA_END=5598 /DNA_ORIENTATION=-